MLRNVVIFKNVTIHSRVASEMPYGVVAGRTFQGSCEVLDAAEIEIH